MPDFTLDHIVIAVRDLEGATKDYATLLGRGPSWHGSHPTYGTRNTLFRIDNTYIELLSLGKSKSGQWAGELASFLDKDEGLYALALGTRAIDADVRILRDRELPVQDPREGDGIDQLTNARRAWRNAMVPTKSTKGTRIFFIEHTAGPRRAAGGADQRGGRCARAADGPRRGALARPGRLAQAVGRRAGRAYGAGPHVSGAQHAHRVLPAGRYHRRDQRRGAADRGRHRQAGPAVGRRWGVENLKATVERLRAANVEVSDARTGVKPGTLVATAKGAHTHGVATLLIEHTPESFRLEARAAVGAAYDNAPQRRAFTSTGLDHVAIAVSDTEAAAETWRVVLGIETEARLGAPSTKSRIATLPGGETQVVLAQALREQHPVAEWIAERGEGMYAIAISVDDIVAAVRDLRAKGVAVGDVEQGAWPGTRVARIERSAANGVSVQLVQRVL